MRIEHPRRVLFIDKLYRVDHDWRGQVEPKIMNRALDIHRTAWTYRPSLITSASRLGLIPYLSWCACGPCPDVLCSRHLCPYSTILVQPRHCTSHDLMVHRFKLRETSRWFNSSEVRNASVWMWILW